MNRYSSGPQTRSRSRLRSNGNESINSSRSAKRARPANANRPRSASRNRYANANRPRSASRNIYANANRPRSASRNRYANRPRSASRNRSRSAAAEEPQRLEIQREEELTQPYSQEELSLDLRPPFVRANSAHLEPQPLERRLSASERHLLAESSGSDLLLVEVSENKYFSAEENSPPNSQSLQRFHSVTEHQSPLRFVLYTGDVEIAQRFSHNPPIYIEYNSRQRVPLTSVFLNRNSGTKRDQIKSRLPQSVQHLSQGFTDQQYDNALTREHYFLLTIERDTRTLERDDIPSEPPTGEIYGVLCCSEETATRNSADFVDSAGARLINFDIFANSTRYIYVHLFTFLSDKTVGYDFFTGSFMLEGLYDLFNHRREQRIIYLEAITVPATIQFYERFGMERLNTMVLTSTIPGNPPISIHFDPFQGVIVPAEVPFVLLNFRQIQEAAIAAKRTRQARKNATGQRLQAGIDPDTIPQPTDEQIRRLEAAVSQFFIEKARDDPRGGEQHYFIHRGP